MVGGKFVDELGKAAIRRLKAKLGLNTEEKWADVTATTTVNTTLGARIAFPAIPQGDTVGSRQGASVRVTRVQYRVDFQAAAAATAGTQIRIIVAGMHGRPGAVAGNEILTTSTNFSSLIDPQVSANGIQIFSDEIVTVGFKEAENSNVSWIKNLNVGDDWHANWPDSDTTGLESALLRGDIGVYWMADAVTTAPSVNGKGRVWFVDN